MVLRNSVRAGLAALVILGSTLLSGCATTGRPVSPPDRSPNGYNKNASYWDPSNSEVRSRELGPLSLLLNGFSSRGASKKVAARNAVRTVRDLHNTSQDNYQNRAAANVNDGQTRYGFPGLAEAVRKSEGRNSQVILNERPADKNGYRTVELAKAFGSEVVPSPRQEGAYLINGKAYLPSWSSWDENGDGIVDINDMVSKK